MYRNAVVKQSVKTTKEMEEEAKKLENTIRSRVSSQNSDVYRDAIEAELASYGFDSYDKLYDYCLMTVEQKALNKDYVDAHFDTLKDSMKDAKSRIVSLIQLEVADPSNLTEAETKKRDNIDNAIETGTSPMRPRLSRMRRKRRRRRFVWLFGFFKQHQLDGPGCQFDCESARTQRRRDERLDRSAKPVDGNHFAVQSARDTTDLDTIHQSKDSAVQDSFLYAVLNATPGLEVTVLENAAKDLDIHFEDKAVQTKLDNYMNQLKGGTTNE